MSTENVSLSGSDDVGSNAGSSHEQSTENNYSENELGNEAESDEYKSSQQSVTAQISDHSGSTSFNYLNGDIEDGKGITACAIVPQKTYQNRLSYNEVLSATNENAAKKSCPAVCCKSKEKYMKK